MTITETAARITIRDFSAHQGFALLSLGCSWHVDDATMLVVRKGDRYNEMPVRRYLKAQTAAGQAVR